MPINELIHVDDHFYFSETSESKAACVCSCNVVSINGDPNKCSLPDTVERRGVYVPPIFFFFLDMLSAMRFSVVTEAVSFCSWAHP